MHCDNTNKFETSPLNWKNEIRTTLLLIGALFLVSCDPTDKSTSHTRHTPVTDPIQPKERNAITRVSKADFRKKVFDMGNETHLTDSCSFYFECDCCSGKLVFDSDSTFYYIDYCMSDETVRRGVYNLANELVKLEFGPFCVSKKYNFENEVDTSAVDFIMTDTTVKPVTIEYVPKKCNDKLQLVNPKGSYHAIETHEDYQKNMDNLTREHFIERLNR